MELCFKRSYMYTEILQVTDESIKKASDIILNGGLVAFHTETVYGLGANTFDASAVKKIFEAKGRPADNPLISHIYDKSQLSSLVKNITPTAEKLIENFWPGPLTIILERSDKINETVSAGLETISVRMPESDCARRLLTECGVPIAAPSANISGRTSPTQARHVYTDFNGKIELILDGGACVFGLESTVVDARNIPKILRPGSITPDMIKAVCGEVIIDPSVLSKPSIDLIPISPGQKYTHYSPKAEVYLIEGDLSEKVSVFTKNNAAKKVAILTNDKNKSLYNASIIISLGDPNVPDEIGANFYKSLRLLDEMKVDVILSETYDDTVHLALMNRMLKSAGHKYL